MIVFDLHCEHGHRFEGWFGSTEKYDDQLARGLVSCPDCGTGIVGKAPMAPAVPSKGNKKDDAVALDLPDRQPLSNTPMPPEVQNAMRVLADAQAKALKKSTWVGDKFAEASRRMHYGECDQKPIHGQATPEQAKSLVDEGVAIAPLPFPVAPPDKLN